MNLPIQTPANASASNSHDHKTLTPVSVLDIGEQCINCGMCLNECAFLATNGTPGQIAQSYLQSPANNQLTAFSCSLCSLCTHICPLSLEPSRMFLDIRRAAVQSGHGKFKEHKNLLAYEKIGSSHLFQFSYIPAGCKSVFFPGCALPGARPEGTLQLYLELKKHNPNLGIILDCCNKPSHDLGRQQFFKDRLRQTEQDLHSKGVTDIITGCTNCYQLLSQNSNILKISLAYSHLARYGVTPEIPLPTMECIIHDPCTTRFEDAIHSDVRVLAKQLNIQLGETEHTRDSALCCGEGGAAGCLKGSHAASWSEKRHKETMDRPVITYCAGCTSTLQTEGSVHHLVDFIFPTAEEFPKSRKVTSPQTYWNRLKLKFRLFRILR